MEQLQLGLSESTLKAGSDRIKENRQKVKNHFEQSEAAQKGHQEYTPVSTHKTYSLNLRSIRR